MTAAELWSLDDGSRLDDGAGLDDGGLSDDVDRWNDAAPPRFGLVDRVPSTTTNPIYRYRDGPVVLYRVPSESDQPAAIRLLLNRGYLK